MESCLSPEEIEAYCSDDTLDELKERVERHKAKCAKCRERVEDRSLRKLFEDAIKKAFIEGTETQPGKENSSIPHPKHIGSYRIIEHIGEGGFGYVFRAEQTGPIRRQVALKIIKPGMDTKQVIARFEAERQALAIMDHPNVAKVLDAGTTDEGRPYFVMEHVAGVPITEHCDRHRLGIEARLELFTQVCEAVQHAHQKGIIHRDIKPSNILVSIDSDKAVPKVIDFGVAKAINQRLTDKTFDTHRGQIIGTLEYMAPEQAEMTGQDIDTRSDIYSLGVLLYELLTGKLPLDVRRGAYDEIVRIIREVEPSKPSAKLSTMLTSGADDTADLARSRHSDTRSLARRIRGDLDWITMKCLEKDRTRRYASASELAQNIRKHLRHEPLDFPYDLRHRVKKFVRRNRGLLVRTSLAAALILMAGVAVSFKLDADKVRREQARGQLDEIKLLALRYPDEALSQLDTMIIADPDFAEAKITRVVVLNREGRHDEATAVAEAILADHPEHAGKAHILLAQLQRDPERAKYHRKEGRRLLPDDLFYRAQALGRAAPEKTVELLTRFLTEVERWNFEALSLRATCYHDLKKYEEMLKDATELTEARRGSAITWELKGAALLGLEKSEDALESFNRAIELDSDHWYAYLDRANALFKLGDYKKSLDDCKLSLALKADHAQTYSLQAWNLYNLRKLDDALQACEHALKLNPREAFANACRAYALIDKGKLNEAKAALNHAIEQKPKLLITRQARGYVNERLRDYEGAVDDYTIILEMKPNDIRVLYNRGVAYLNLRKMEKARTDFDRVIELATSLPITANITAIIASAHYNLGRWYLIGGEYKQALAAYQKAIDSRPDSPYFILGRALAHWFSGDEDSAITDLKTAIEKAPPSEFAVAHLWIWEIQSLRGQTAAANAALDAARKACTDKFEQKIIAHIRGEISAKALLAEAEGVEQRCTAYYYAGSRAFVERRREEALNLYLKCLEAGAEDLSVCDIAKWRMQY